jgi:hypothetical protein
MKKHKRILGLIGLLLVAAITAVAAHLPDYEASAVGPDTTINITVEGDDFSAIIVTPSDGSEVSSATGTAVINYTGAKYVTVYLTDEDTGATTCLATSDPSVTPCLSNVTTPNPDGSLNVNYALPDYGDYTISTEGVDLSGDPLSGSTSTFGYHAIWLEVTNDGEETDPEVRVHINDPTTDHVTITVVGKDGNVYEVTVPVTPEDIATGYVDVNLPFRENGVQPGDYTVEGVGYNSDGDALDDPSAVDLAYFPSNIEPPKTGLFGLGGLTLSRADYLVTGLLVFSLVAFLAFFLLRRKKAERRR